MLVILKALVVTLTLAMLALQLYAFGCEQGWLGLVDLDRPWLESDLRSILIFSAPSFALCLGFLVFGAPYSKESNIRIATMYFSLCAWLPYTVAIGFAGIGLADGCYRNGLAPGAEALIYIVVFPGAFVAVLSGVVGVCYGKVWNNKFLKSTQS